jgi:hypothetical protein
MYAGHSGYAGGRTGKTGEAENSWNTSKRMKCVKLKDYFMGMLSCADSGDSKSQSILFLLYVTI